MDRGDRAVRQFRELLRPYGMNGVPHFVNTSNWRKVCEIRYNPVAQTVTYHRDRNSSNRK